MLVDRERLICILANMHASIGVTVSIHNFCFMTSSAQKLSSNSLRVNSFTCILSRFSVSPSVSSNALFNLEVGDLHQSILPSVN
jgi:hypothetical protein